MLKVQLSVFFRESEIVRSLDARQTSFPFDVLIYPFNFIFCRLSLSIIIVREGYICYELLKTIMQKFKVFV